MASSYTLTLLNHILGRSSCSILSLGQAGMTSGISKTLTRSNLKPPQLTDFFVWVEIKTPKKLSSLQTQTDVTPPCMPINSHWPHSKEHEVPFDFDCFFFFKKTRRGGGSYILSSLKSVSSSAEFDEMGESVRRCQFEQSWAECRRRLYREQVCKLFLGAQQKSITYF